jgi:hypothetical protein
MFEYDASSALWGVTPILLVVGGIFHVISIGAPHWLAKEHVHMGLWTYCNSSVSRVKDKTDFVNPVVEHCSAVNIHLNAMELGQF